MFGGAFSSACRGVRAAQHALEPLGLLKKGEAPLMLWMSMVAFLQVFSIFRGLLALFLKSYVAATNIDLIAPAQVTVKACGAAASCGLQPGN